MILVNKNFGSPALSSVIGDMFRSATDASQNVDYVRNTGALASGSTLVASMSNTAYVYASGNTTGSSMLAPFNAQQTVSNNFYIVTEQFIKTLDKVYTKIWNESFTETGIYTPSNLATLYYGFVSDNSSGDAGAFMTFKKFVDRCITAGVLVEADRLDYKDQIFISGVSRSNMSTQVDTTNKLIIMTHATPIDISPDIDTQTGQYLNGKKIYLMMTPYLTNESVIKGLNYSFAYGGPLVTPTPSQEPFVNALVGINFGTGTGWSPYTYPVQTPVRRPIAFFKPKTDASKYGRSLPMATHFFWSMGTPADKAAAIAAGKPIPDLIFDHLDRISHIDSLVLKIKYDKLQF